MKKTIPPTRIVLFLLLCVSPLLPLTQGCAASAPQSAAKAAPAQKTASVKRGDPAKANTPATGEAGEASTAKTPAKAPATAPVPTKAEAPATAKAPPKAIVIPAGTTIRQSDLLPTAKAAATPGSLPLSPGVQAPPPQTSAIRSPAPQAPGGQAASQSAVAACWLPLLQKLAADGMDDPLITRYFTGLAEYSAEPMGVKVKEMFTNAFVRKPPTKVTPTGPSIPRNARIYKNVVTRTTMETCALFLQNHKKAFDAVEKKYSVPREIITALLYVETRLGGYIGKENAFWSLACMAAADSPERVKEGVAALPLTTEHDAWLRAKLEEKSRWAYAEIKALLVYCRAKNLNPHGMPGSVYGAVGLCQFMPSNLVPYGDDGNGDGVVNLFAEPDAIFSVAKYLTGHGWKGTPTVDRQRTVLKRYNNLTVYANTILTLAESLRTGVAQIAPPDVDAEALAAILKAREAKPAPKAKVKAAVKKKVKAASGKTSKAAIKKTVKTAPKKTGKKTK